MTINRRQALASLVAAAAGSVFPLKARGQVRNTRLQLGAALGDVIPHNYVGLSYETAQLAEPNFFSADNAKLITLFHSLSKYGVLRIGGNSSEFCWWKTQPDQQAPALPATAGQSDNWMPHQFTAIEPIAIDHLSGFLDATEWKTIYGLNLGTGTPQRAAEEAEYVAKVLGSRLLFFQIGNEPEYYRDANNRLRSPDWNFDRYLAQWMMFAQAVITRVPEARFGGPDVGSNAEWVMRFAEEASKKLPGRIVACTSHYYAEGPPDSPNTTISRLLAPDPRVERDVPCMAVAARQAGVQYRMTEGNTCYRGGKPGLSNAFCSALWATDYLLQLASYGCAGVNLHGGGTKQIQMSLGGHLPGKTLQAGAAKVAEQGSFYTPIAGSRESGFTARPVFYGMKLASLLAGGKMRLVNLDVEGADVAAYAADFPDRGTCVILINKDTSRELAVRIKSKKDARLWRLEADSLTATDGVTLAGRRISDAEQWRPRHEERLQSKKDELLVTIAAASAGAILFDQILS